MAQKKESITEYAKRMRELCGLNVAQGRNSKTDNFYMQNEDYSQFAEKARVEDENGFKIYEIEQTEVKKEKDDDELYKL